MNKSPDALRELRSQWIHFLMMHGHEKQEVEVSVVAGIVLSLIDEIERLREEED